MDFAVGIIRTMLASGSLSEFCENVITNFSDTRMVGGIEIFVRENLGSLTLLHHIAVAGFASRERLSLEDPSCAAQAYRHKVISRETVPAPAVSAPIEVNGVLLGSICLTLADESSLDRVLDEHMRVIAVAVSAFMTSRARVSLNLNSRGASRGRSGELTPRQLQILKRMCSGEIYSQIARHMHISESLVKLEASRIFKHFGVANKQDAISAGRELLNATTPPPRELVAG